MSHVKSGAATSDWRARRPGRTVAVAPSPFFSGPAAARTKRAAAILAPLDTIPDYRGASALRTRGGWTEMDVRALLEDVAATYRGLRSLRAEVFSRTESGDTNEGSTNHHKLRFLYRAP